MPVHLTKQAHVASNRLPFPMVLAASSLRTWSLASMQWTLCFRGGTPPSTSKTNGVHPFEQIHLRYDDSIQSEVFVDVFPPDARFFVSTGGGQSAAVIY